MNASRKWVQLLFDIIDHEVEDGPLLTDGAHALVARHPVAGRVFIVSVGTAVTLHLARCIRPEYDLVSQAFWKGIFGELRGFPAR